MAKIRTIQYLPTISRKQQILPALKTWGSTLNRALREPAVLTAPQNVAVAIRGDGTLITWHTVEGADGYEILAGTTANFTDPHRTIMLEGQAQNAYFDKVSAAQASDGSTLYYYKVRALSGTTSNPHTVKGALSNVVSAAMAPVSNAEQAVGTTSLPSTTSTSFSDLAEMSQTITTRGGKVFLSFFGVMANTTPATLGLLRFTRDGAEIGTRGQVFPGGSTIDNTTLTMIDTVAPGTYGYKVQFATSGTPGSGSFSNISTFRALQVTELL